MKIFKEIAMKIDFKYGIDLDEKIENDFYDNYIFCKRVFGEQDKFTIQQYIFLALIRYGGYENFYETLPNMEKLKVDFLIWQNKPTPEVDGTNDIEKHFVTSHSHEDDQTWNSLDLWISKVIYRTCGEFDFRPLTEKNQLKSNAQDEYFEEQDTDDEMFFSKFKKNPVNLSDYD